LARRKWRSLVFPALAFVAGGFFKFADFNQVHGVFRVLETTATGSSTSSGPLWGKAAIMSKAASLASTRLTARCLKVHLLRQGSGSRRTSDAD
jgi:hypothetical protein